MIRFLIMLPLLCFACGKPQEPSKLSRIIGENDLSPVVLDKENGPLVRAIGRMRIGCTVSHIGGGLGITAGHCFKSMHFEGIQKMKSCDFDRFRVVWGLVSGNEEPIPARCQEVIAFEYNKKRDYAIVRIDQVPEAFVELNFAVPEIGREISIYSHPQRRALEWSNICEVEKIYAHPREGLMAYRCDTEVGSSGAPIVNRFNQMIGIHVFYDDDIDRNGGLPLSMLPPLDIIL